MPKSPIRVVTVIMAFKHKNEEEIRLRLNWLQTDSGNDFPENGVFGCYFKFGQTVKHFQLTENESQNNGKSFSFPFSLQMISDLGK